MPGPDSGRAGRGRQIGLAVLVLLAAACVLLVFSTARAQTFPALLTLRATKSSRHHGATLTGDTPARIGCVGWHSVPSAAVDNHGKIGA